MIFRELKFDELDEIWNIDRSEFIEAVYELNNGVLKEIEIGKAMSGWSPETMEVYIPLLKDCFKSGGSFMGGYISNKLKAVGVLESKFIGKNSLTLQLKFLHIDREYRGMGFGKILFTKLLNKAKELGAKRLYISSCENRNTVQFYQNMGCVITADIDPELYKLEPCDIHMDYIITDD